MKAIVLNKVGNADVMKITDTPKPRLSQGNVLVKNRYVGINYAEILSRKGVYGWSPKRPYILGMESSGVIEEVGEGVDNSRIGQKVIVGAKCGTYAEYTAVPELQAIPAVENYSMEENASFLVNYLTSWVALFRMAGIKPGDKVLISAAAGGVGTAAVQLSVKQGCRVYGLAGSKEKLDFLNSLGVVGALNYNEKHWDEKLKSTTNGVDVVLELVGGDVNKSCFKILNPFGRIVVAGFASLNLNKWNPYSIYKTYKDIPRFKTGELAEKSVAVMSTHIGKLLDQNADLLTEQFEELMGFVAGHDIRPVIDRVFPLYEAALAHEYIESRQSIGKVLLKV